MPIYEYLCRPCNTVYNFLVQDPNTSKQPECPRCGSTDMKKRLSTFSISGGPKKSAEAQEPETDEDGGEDPEVEREMNKLMQRAENIDENNPRQLGELMRRMSEVSGEEMDEATDEAVRRLEKGEDPDKIEEEMGDILGGEEEGGAGASGAPSHDEGLYPL